MPKLGAEEVYLAGKSRGVKAKKEPPPESPSLLWVGPIPHYPPGPHRQQCTLRYNLRMAVAHKREGEAATWRVALADHERVHGVLPG